MERRGFMLGDIHTLKHGYLGVQIRYGYPKYATYAILSPEPELSTIRIPRNILGTDKEYALIAGVELRALRKHTHKIGKIPPKTWRFFDAAITMRFDNIVSWTTISDLEKELMGWL